VISMNELQQQKVKRRIRAAVSEIDAMKAQLAEVRRCCEELSAAMRQIREESENARERVRHERELAERRSRLKRVV